MGYKLISFHREDFSEVRRPCSDAVERKAWVYSEMYPPVNREAMTRTDGGWRFTFTSDGRTFHAYYKEVNT